MRLFLLSKFALLGDPPGVNYPLIHDSHLLLPG
jgi:hypothetical protein